MKCSISICNDAHRGYLGEGILLLLTPESVVQSHGDYTRMQGTHSLHSQPGKEGKKQGREGEGRKKEGREEGREERRKGGKKEGKEKERGG